MDAELFKQIKNIAAQLNRDLNNILEEAALDSKKIRTQGTHAEPKATSKCLF
jgi:hypothetical protein